MHVHQFWWAWSLRFQRYHYSQKRPIFPFGAWTMVIKNLIDWNWLKKFMQVGIDVKCMYTDFGGCGLWFRRYHYSQKRPIFPFGAWTIYSPWSSKNLIDRNWLKIFLHVGVDVTCMHTNFGGRGLSSFGDIDILKSNQTFLSNHRHSMSLFTFVFVYLCVCLLPLCLFTFVYLCVGLPLFTSLFVYLCVCLLLCLFTSVFVYLCVCLPLSLFTSVFVYLCLCLSLSLFTSVFVYSPWSSKKFNIELAQKIHASRG